MAVAMIVLTACTTPAPAPPVTTAPARPQMVAVPYTDLPGWHDDDLRAAWPAFLKSCRALRARPTWSALCAAAPAVPADDGQAIRGWFEQHFIAHRLGDTQGAASGLITGYYEPLLRGSRSPRPPYSTPLYAVPDDLLTIDLAAVYPQLAGMRLRGRLEGNKVVPYPSRADIVRGALPASKALVWVDDPMAAFFLQVQGSGRVEIDQGNGRSETLRLGYADQNGHPYKAIGRWLVEQGQMPVEQVSMQSILAWAATHPQRADELLNSNPSYVFFRESPITDPTVGPNGALGVPLTPERSIAVDRDAIPLGSPVFLDTTDPLAGQPLRRLVMAQDTGGAVRGVIRADYFWGFGTAAGERAGLMKQRGRMWVLLPR